MRIRLREKFVRLVAWSYRLARRFLGRRGLSKVWPLGFAARKITAIIRNHHWPEVVEMRGKKIYAPQSLRGFLAAFEGGVFRLDAELFQREIPAGATVLDVGANIGYYALIFSDIAGKSGKVFAFEPGDDNLAYLRKNVQANGCDNVEVVPRAAGGENKKTRLFLDGANPGGHNVIDIVGRLRNKASPSACEKEWLKHEEADEWRGSVWVSMVRLDDFFAGYARPIDFIKLDVEGAEGLALRGMKNILRKNKNIKLHFEFWPAAMRLAGAGPEEFLETLSSFGFIFYDLAGFERGRSAPAEITAEDLLEKYRGKSSTNVLAKRA